MPNFGGTITSGIQDIAALLPLLGTEQCERHVGSALAGGYLYAVATPLSIFGSLGIFKAGFVALIASFSIGRVGGAMKLADAGFGPTGDSISMITIDKLSMTTIDKGRYVAETRLLSMLRDQHIDNVGNLTLDWNCRSWNWRMCWWSLMCPILSFTPYVYFTLRDHNNHTTFTTWAFPISRAVGSVLTALMVQFVIQHRVVTILKKRLIFMTMEADVEELERHWMPFEWSQDSTSEMCLWSLEQYLRRMGPSSELQTKLNREMKKHFPTTERRLQMWALQICRLVLFLGLGLSLIGYVGCFSIVQGSRNGAGPPLWLGLESTLSFLRVVLWAWNPRFDEDTYIHFKLKLVAQKPFVTCDRFFEEMEAEGEFPVVREEDFLEEITSCMGPLPRLTNKNVSLYYTHTTRRRGPDSENKRVLCITIFDYKEQDSITLVRICDSDQSRFFTSSLVNSTDGTLAAKLLAEVHPESNYITGDGKFLRALREHCNAIVHGLNLFHVIGNDVGISTQWILAILGPPEPTRQWRSRAVIDDSGYLKQMEIERQKAYFTYGAGQWISSYIKQAQAVVDRSDGKMDPEFFLFLAEWDEMENMMLLESTALEQQFRQHLSEIRNGVEVTHLKRRFSREWAKNVENRLAEESQQFLLRCTSVQSVLALSLEALDKSKQTEDSISVERRKTMNLKELADNAPLTTEERWRSLRERLKDIAERFEEKKHRLLGLVKVIEQDKPDGIQVGDTQQRYLELWSETENRVRRERDGLIVRLYLQDLMLFSKVSEWNIWDFRESHDRSLARLDRLSSKYFVVSSDDDLALLVAAGQGLLSKKINITTVHFHADFVLQRSRRQWNRTEVVAALKIQSITSIRDLPLLSSEGPPGDTNAVIEVLGTNKNIMSMNASTSESRLAIGSHALRLLEHNRNSWETRAKDRPFEYIIFYEKPYVVWHHDRRCLRFHSDEGYGNSECVIYIYTEVSRTVVLNITYSCHRETKISIRSGGGEQEEKLSRSRFFRRQIIPLARLLTVGFNVLRLCPTQTPQAPDQYLLSDLEILPKDVTFGEPGEET